MIQKDRKSLPYRRKLTQDNADIAIDQYEFQDHYKL
jgi:hypothetical protein